MESNAQLSCPFNSGVSSMETASIGGAAHLVNFCGSDTMPGITNRAGAFAVAKHTEGEPSLVQTLDFK